MRIGEVAAAADTTAKTIRFYEQSGLLPAAERSENGYRSYAEDTVSKLRFIRRGQAAGLTLAQIGDILQLRDDGYAPCAHVQNLLTRQLTYLDRQITELLALRAAVAEFHAGADNADPASCDPDRICSLL
ncbi:DNA-binding transcriptional MerR regulator [Arthrobacter sp. CAN_A214]|uniref:heavy metal-responsive transcriptional regulator n=1 Tax=Arthrobacter sp. CAN_A214 TaxID=2787720 RepID=UPI0018C9D38E